jgi:hypothetical protein
MQTTPWPQVVVPSRNERRHFHASAVVVQWHIWDGISQTLRPLNRLYR